MLKIEDLNRTFNPGTADEKKALRHVSLEVEDGAFVTVLGSNGAGKSTLFGCLSGAEIPDSGRILLDEKNITFLPEHRRARFIGQMFQDPLRGTAPHMTIEENLALAYLRAGDGRSPFSMISGADRKMFRERLALLGMGLEDRMKTPVGTLSGGQRQALTLLMATIVPPKLLLLDEHTAALDPAAAEKVMALTQETVRKYRITCLMVTHNLTMALSAGTRILMMADGRIVRDIRNPQGLTPDDLMREFRSGAGQAMDDDRMVLRV